jgi:hypothetical protein
MDAQDLERYFDGWLPTAENINRLPWPLRKYIHDLETRTDIAGDIRELTIARDIIRQLETRLLQLEEGHENKGGSLDPTSE